MTNPECFNHCPRIRDAAERVAQLGRTGVVLAETVVKSQTEALISECANVADSECDGPLRQTVTSRPSLLGRLGLLNTPGSDVEYVCGVTGHGPQEKRYIFKDN